MNYKQFLDKVTKFRVDAGINTHCNRCADLYPSETYPFDNPDPDKTRRPRPCELDYDIGGYFWNSKSLISVMDFCEGIIEDVVGGTFATKYFKLHAGVRESLYNATLFENVTSDDVRTLTWAYPDAEINDVFSDANAALVKSKLSVLNDANTLKIGTDIVAIESKFPRTESPNGLMCSPIFFYNLDFTPYTGVLNTSDSKDITRKMHARYWHMFINGKKRLNVKNVDVTEISAIFEYHDYMTYNSASDLYKTLYLDGTSVTSGNKQYFIDSINAGRNRVLVQDIFFATAFVWDNEIYLDFDVSNGEYLVRVKEDYWHNIRMWIVLKELSGLDITYPELATMQRHLLLHRSDFQAFQSTIDNICVAIYSWPRSGIVIGPGKRGVREHAAGLKEPKLRFLLVNA